MSAIKEYYHEHVYAADFVECEIATESDSDYLPEFPEDLKIGSLTLSPNGVMLRFSPTGGVLAMHEIATPIKPLSLAN
ncbi:hypothetical protein [Bdellovibrio sp. HCB209]|uniref:hypothetical protein n=1 Tax=Bdellovibrio sp. HCB209 TaxID=3394354 RepID=UPI0039B43C54